MRRSIVGVQTKARMVDPPPPDAFPMQPTMGVQTTARFVDPPSNEPTSLPISGEHTVAREVDQVALAEAANAAAAMFQLPGILRADGTAMPRFRMSNATLQGDELAASRTFKAGFGLAGGVGFADVSSLARRAR